MRPLFMRHDHGLRRIDDSQGEPDRCRPYPQIRGPQFRARAGTHSRSCQNLSLSLRMGWKCRESTERCSDWSGAGSVRRTQWTPCSRCSPLRNPRFCCWQLCFLAFPLKRQPTRRRVMARNIPRMRSSSFQSNIPNGSGSPPTSTRLPIRRIRRRASTVCSTIFSSTPKRTRHSNKRERGRTRPCWWSNSEQRRTWVPRIRIIRGLGQSSVIGIGLHVKDEAHFAGSGPSSAFQGAKTTASMTPVTAACYSCHASQGAADTTFVQVLSNAAADCEEQGYAEPRVPASE